MRDGEVDQRAHLVAVVAARDVDGWNGVAKLSWLTIAGGEIKKMRRKHPREALIEACLCLCDHCVDQRHSLRSLPDLRCFQLDTHSLHAGGREATEEEPRGSLAPEKETSSCSFRDP